MSIEIKRSIKPVEYTYAIQLLEKRLNNVINKNAKELIWFLEHDIVYTAGTTSKSSEVLDKSLNIIKTSRGGKITCHSKGQLICYMVLDLNKRKRDIRKFIVILENTIIETFKSFNIKTFSDRKNIGIWINHNKEIKKIAAIGIRVKKWVAYHGFSINIHNNLEYFDKIIPCGLKNKKVIKLDQISKIKYLDFLKILKKNLVKNFSLSNYS